jgi:hypothetical protein
MRGTGARRRKHRQTLAKLSPIASPKPALKGAIEPGCVYPRGDKSRSPGKSAGALPKRCLQREGKFGLPEPQGSTAIRVKFIFKAKFFRFGHIPLSSIKRDPVRGPRPVIAVLGQDSGRGHAEKGAAAPGCGKMGGAAVGPLPLCDRPSRGAGTKPAAARFTVA